MREILALIVTVVVAYLVYALLFASDTPQESGPPPPDTVLPLTMELGIGDHGSVIVHGIPYTLGVSAVFDSRCPGCPDPGKATVVVIAGHAGGKKESLRLATNDVDGYVWNPTELRIASLKPDAVQGQTIGKKEYRVSLVVDYAPGMEAVPDTAAAMAAP